MADSESGLDESDSSASEACWEDWPVVQKSLWQLWEGLGLESNEQKSLLDSAAIEVAIFSL